MQEELYRKMYAKLCVSFSEAIDLLQEANNRLYVIALLQKALWDAEEMYIDAENRGILGIDKGQNY